MKQYSEIDINIIMDILNSYKKEELIPSARSWESWLKSFFFKLDLKGKDMYYINKLKEFKECSDYSEANFKKKFPDLKYNTYSNPMKYNSYNLSKKERQRIEMILQEELPLSWDQTLILVNYYYRRDNWDYESFYRVSGSVCNILQANLFSMDYLKSKGITPKRKVS